jgi:hypothetical protein
MPRTSYLMRREGRYYLQARLTRHVADMAGRALYRASLRTADYRQARQRLVECMAWVHSMNDTVDYVSLFQKNAIHLRQYLSDAWPLPEQRLVARRNYEELLKNMTHRARAVGCDPAMIEPDYFQLFQHFVKQNVEAEEWLRKAENLRHYERGRADMEAKFGLASVPASFRPGTAAFDGRTSPDQDLPGMAAPLLVSQERTPIAAGNGFDQTLPPQGALTSTAGMELPSTAARAWPQPLGLEADAADPMRVRPHDDTEHDQRRKCFPILASIHYLGPGDPAAFAPSAAFYRPALLASRPMNSTEPVFDGRPKGGRLPTVRFWQRNSESRRSANDPIVAVEMLPVDVRDLTFVSAAHTADLGPIPNCLSLNIAKSCRSAAGITPTFCTALGRDSGKIVIPAVAFRR